VLVFTRTKHGANRLAHQLGRSGIAATAIHGNKGQGARTKALADFKAGLVRVLVATDLAARGLDIEELPHVVNYDLPHVAEDYVHRIGRTGRAGNAGEAISLVSPEEQPLLAEIEKLLGRTVDQTVIPGFEPGSAPPPHHQRQPQPQQVQPAAQLPRQPPEGGAQDGKPAREGRGRRRGRGRNRQNGELRNDQRGEQRGDARAAPRDPALPQTTAQPPQPREPNHNRGEANHHNRNNHQARSEAAREDRDNRGNRDTSNRDRNKRNILLDDDFGNRIPPVKAPRGIRARIAAGDIDEELDNIGNRTPPPPKHQRNLDTEEEINFNIAPPPPPAFLDDDDGQQPQSNAGQMFPSSAGFMGELRPGRGNGHGNGNGRSRGNKNRRRGQPPQQQQQRQPQQRRQQPRQGQGQGQKGAARGNGGGRQQARGRSPH
jgi:hypothetical protein